MSRYIDADKARTAIAECFLDMNDSFVESATECNAMIDLAIDKIKELPTEDVKPVVMGEWINGHCSNCGEQALYRNHYEQGGYYFAELFYSDYCPNCGADMRKEDV